MDEGAPSAPVAVDERVNRLELSVGDGCLRDGWERVILDEGAQVLQQLLHEVGGRRDERRRARVEAAATDPVLDAADLPRVLTEAGAGEEPVVHLEQAIDGDRLSRAEGVDRPRHRVDVPEHLAGGDVGVGLARGARRLGAEEPAPAHDESLDERRGNRLRSKE